MVRAAAAMVLSWRSARQGPEKLESQSINNRPNARLHWETACGNDQHKHVFKCSSNVIIVWPNCSNMTIASYLLYSNTIQIAIPASDGCTDSLHRSSRISIKPDSSQNTKSVANKPFIASNRISSRMDIRDNKSFHSNLGKSKHNHSKFESYRLHHIFTLKLLNIVKVIWTTFQKLHWFC